MSTEEWRPRYALPDGTIVEESDRLWLVRGGVWAEARPVECHEGHSLLGAGTVLVGSQACLAIDGCHRTHTCVECGDVVYTPMPTEACDHRAFDGR